MWKVHVYLRVIFSYNHLFSVCVPQESVLLAKDIGGVLVNMMANDTEKHTGEGEAPEGGGIKRMRDVVDEEGKCGSQVCMLPRKPTSNPMLCRSLRFITAWGSL